MSVLRHILERLSRGQVIRRSMNVAGKSVSIFVSPDAQLKYLKPGTAAFDRDLVRIAETMVKSGMVVWDIGANLGTFAIAASELNAGATVLAVDADPFLTGVITRTASMPQHQQRDIRVLCTAVSSQDGVAEFMIAGRGRASNALVEAGGRSQMGGVRERRFVPTLTLDRLSETFPQPDFIKIDVEGAEALVLTGGRQLISAARPTLYVEVSPESFDACLNLMSDLGFQCHDENGKQITAYSTPNVYFVPAERADQVTFPTF